MMVKINNYFEKPWKPSREFIGINISDRWVVEWKKNWPLVMSEVVPFSKAGARSKSRTNSTSTLKGIMHHQIKLDVFLIKGFQVVSNNEIFEPSILINSGMKKTPSSPIAVLDLSEKYCKYFQTLSQLYTSIASIVTLDELSNMPKSNIELFQRFQQILKELQLSFEESPYNKFFQKIDPDHWIINDNMEDTLWTYLSVNIEKVYDKETGQVLGSKRKSTVNSTRGSPLLPPKRQTSTAMSTEFSLNQVNNKLEQMLRQEEYYKVPSESSGQFKWPRAVSDTMLMPDLPNTNRDKSETETTNNGSSLDGSKRKFNNGLDTPEEELVTELVQLRNCKKLKCGTKDRAGNGTNMNVDVYERLLTEKDERIKRLQDDVESQRKEILWLKKLLMEDMKHIRSSLSNLNNS